MKTWWTETGWPWLKGNWWVLLILPLIALVAVGMLAMRFMRKPTVLDPLGPADERAAVEAELRTKQLEAERDRLATELETIREEHASLRAHFESRLHDEVEGLRDDPERLRQLMLRTGRGE